jgi:hypothetical protein
VIFLRVQEKDDGFDKRILFDGNFQNPDSAFAQRHDTHLLVRDAGQSSAMVMQPGGCCSCAGGVEKLAAN